MQFIWLLFVIIGPGLLVLSMLFTALVPMTPNVQYWALLITQLLTSFAAWEVRAELVIFACVSGYLLMQLYCCGDDFGESVV